MSFISTSEKIHMNYLASERSTGFSEYFSDKYLSTGIPRILTAIRVGIGIAKDIKCNSRMIMTAKCAGH